MEQQGRHSPPTNILPSGAKTISLPSGECLETFHLTQSTGEAPPMLDETTAKRRQFLTAHGGPESPRTHLKHSSCPTPVIDRGGIVVERGKKGRAKRKLSAACGGQREKKERGKGQSDY
eukprot:scaffold34669_cov164-Amphora_coffeaeformis.AAC.3